MSPLLRPPNQALLAALAQSRALLAFDFDGTLAPIVADPADARLGARTRPLFGTLCKLYPCAVISGRARADVQRKLRYAAVAFVVGNHGLEPSSARARARREALDVKGWLLPHAQAWKGVALEDKGVSLSLHYRAARNKQAARRALLRALEDAPRDVRVVPGKQVLNVLPARSPDKGQALERLRVRVGATRTLYVGDDVTDEDVFRRRDIPGLVTVRIGKAKHSAARYFLRNQSEIDALMRKLIELRQAILAGEPLPRKPRVPALSAPARPATSGPRATKRRPPSITRARRSP